MLHETVPGATHQFLIDGTIYQHIEGASHPLVEGAGVTITLRYQLMDRLSVGVHWDPRTRHIGPVANFVLMTESGNRPALVVGTSSDRIGLPHGQAYYFNVSKSLKRETRLPIAPYFGIAYSTYDVRLRPMGGVNVALPYSFSSIAMFDGVNLHQVVNYRHGRNILSFILVRGKHPGVAYSFSF